MSRRAAACIAAARVLGSYAGPVAYNKQGTNLWMYRWHQTWWYLSELDWKFADSEDDFTKPVLYSSMVAEPICGSSTTFGSSSSAFVMFGSSA